MGCGAPRRLGVPGEKLRRFTMAEMEVPGRRVLVGV
jgi:hypothetical protein